MTNLSQEDLARIEHIERYLLQLNDEYFPALAPQFIPYTPLAEPKSEPKEQPSVEPECEKQCGSNHCDTNGCSNRERHLVEAEHPEGKWKPKVGETYYFPDFRSMYLYDQYTWKDNKIDKTVFNNIGCYKTEEEATKASDFIKQVLSNVKEVTAFLNTLKK